MYNRIKGILDDDDLSDAAKKNQLEDVKSRCVSFGKKATASDQAFAAKQHAKGKKDEEEEEQKTIVESSGFKSAENEAKWDFHMEVNESDLLADLFVEDMGSEMGEDADEEDGEEGDEEDGEEE